MKPYCSSIFTCLLLLSAAAKADLSSNLLAYYNFEESGAPGLANKAPGATSYDATRGGTLFADWATGDNPTGPGFAGKADFTATTSGISDRSDLHVGNALNLDEDRDEYIRVPVGTTDLGINFTISAWHALTPGAANTSNRFHTFEAETGFDVSWGTSNTAFTTPQTAYPYLAYIGEAPGGGFGPASVASQAWHHVAHCVSSNGTTTTLRLYVDGSLIASRTVDTNLIAFDAILFGRHRTSTTGDRDWDGMIDEVALWNRTLTANEVNEIYQRGSVNVSLTGDLATVGKAFLSINSSDPVMGQATGTGLYDLNEEANIQASPNAGYVFVNWTSPFASQTDLFQHTVTTSVTTTANFAQDTADDDLDGLTNYQEIVLYFTNPTLADTDGDQINDGDEVTESLTDPLVSQIAAVNYIVANLGNNNPGAIVLTRNTSNNTLSMKITAQDSINLTQWNTIDSSSPGVSASLNQQAYQLEVPATSDNKRFVRIQGSAP